MAHCAALCCMQVDQYIELRKGRSLVGLGKPQTMPSDIGRNLIVEIALSTLSYDHTCMWVRNIPEWNLEIPLNNNTNQSLSIITQIKQNENDNLEVPSFICKHLNNAALFMWICEP